MNKIEKIPNFKTQISNKSQVSKLKSETNFILMLFKSIRLSLTSLILHEFRSKEAPCSNSELVWNIGAWYLNIVCDLLFDFCDFLYSVTQL